MLTPKLQSNKSSESKIVPGVYMCGEDEGLKSYFMSNVVVTSTFNTKLESHGSGNRSECVCILVSSRLNQLRGQSPQQVLERQGGSNEGSKLLSMLGD